ncbi:MAG: monovalent cation:proton antiporter-2 (CPA2) family protein [Bacteroidales bacterium]|nr:monovalent cation:proton antiporter-2 (CPA2) family protein [Bacteroidales bacterium]
MDGFLFQAMIYLAAAVVCVPIAKKLGMGSVLGYLMAGVIIGPFLIGFIGDEGEDIMHFAEFGVVMMLFLIGLELEPKKLWAIRKQIIGVGMSQVVGTTLIFFALGLAFRMQWQAALAVSLALSLSSTAIVLQTYKEKGQLNTPVGQNSFSVLLFQDIAVIPMLALFPLLVFLPVDHIGHHTTFIENLPAWMQTVAVLVVVSSIVLIGRFALVPILRIIAKTHLRELFTASALLIVVGIAFLMYMVGLSPALGTFLAGVVLANSEFKHELESDLDPFKGLLLGLFFMAVGASINFRLIAENPSLIIGITLGIVALKMTVIFLIGKIFKYPVNQNLTFAIGLAQVGEFAFVLLSLIGQLKILSKEETDIMMAITASSMTVTPLIILLNEKLIQPRFSKQEKEDSKTDVINESNKVIIAGFSHFGSTIGRFLRANEVEATYLDYNSNQVDLLRRLGFKVYYGDATRADLLESAGASQARLLIIAIDSPETNFELVKTAKKHFPNLEVMVRARNRMDAYELLDLGIDNIYREHLDTSIQLGVDVLKKLGTRAYSAHRAGQNFKNYDESAMRELYKHRHDKKVYLSQVRQQIQIQEDLLQTDIASQPNLNDHAWDGEHLREIITKDTK